MIVAVLIILAYLMVGAWGSYLWHKEVSESYQKEFAKKTFTSETTGNERIDYIEDNMEAMVYRLQMIETAEERIILSTFDFDADEAGLRVLAALLNAADRGVSVRVIVDGLSGLMDFYGNAHFQAFVSHENAAIKIYNPINPLLPWKTMARLHDKYLLIDDDMYLLGGRNTIKLFLGDYVKRKNHDSELFVYSRIPGEGESLRQLLAYSQRIWDLPESKEYICKKVTKKTLAAKAELYVIYNGLKTEYPQAFQSPDWYEKTLAAEKVSLLTNPIEAVNKEPTLWYALTELMKSGESITIHTPFIICSKAMYASLKDICEDVGDVEIITNAVANGANPWGCCDYLNESNNILASGMKVYEFIGDTSKHTKIILIGHRLSVIGSFNVDMRSVYLDTEMMLVVDCKELNARLREETLVEKEYCRFVSMGEEYEYGVNYEEREISGVRYIIYAILRVVIRPFRHLL